MPFILIPVAGLIGYVIGKNDPEGEASKQVTGGVLSSLLFRR